MQCISLEDASLPQSRDINKKSHTETEDMLINKKSHTETEDMLHQSTTQLPQTPTREQNLAVM